MRLICVMIASLMLALPARADVGIQVVTSPGGIKAWLVEEHSLPFVAMELAFRGGTSLDEPGKRGAINLMSGLLEEGAGDLDARGFARAAQELATSIGFGADAEEFSISARFLTENRDASVELIRAAIQTPRFDPADIERVRAQVISGMAFDQNDPNDIAGKVLASKMFGDHPYGTPQEGTPESVAALTREDLLTAHQNVLVRDRVLVGVVGDITPDELGAMLDRLLDGIPQSGPPLPPVVTPDTSSGLTVVDLKTPQSVALFAQQGVGILDPDYFPAFLLNHIIGGGGFSARLMTEVREKRGLTYGVYSYLYPRDLGNAYLGSVSSANDRIGQAIDVIRDEWAKAARDGVTQKELADAKTYLTGAYPLRFDGNGTIAGILVGMQLIGLGPDYPKTRNARVEAVTLEDVQRVAGELLDPEGLMFVVVGQPEGLATFSE